MACLSISEKHDCPLDARIHIGTGSTVIGKCLEELPISKQMSLDCALCNRFFALPVALRTWTTVYLSCWRHCDFKTVESMKKICTGQRVSADSGGVRTARALRRKL
jgi:hypothetical protein